MARGFSRSIKSRQRLVHLIAARVDGTGAASMLSGSNEITLTDNGVGDYTLTFAVPFKKVPVITALALTAATQIKLHAVAVGSCQIKTFAMDGTTAQDADFHVMIVGQDAADEV